MKTQTSIAWSDTAAHENGFVTANGMRLHYLDWGGSGPVLILIHGGLDNAHVFDDLAPAFTDRFRVVAYDRRGHGRSDAIGPFDTATRTADRCGLMDELRVAKAHLAGWSLGGNDITAMAGTHPERVDSIVYLEGAYDWGGSAVADAFKSLPRDFLAPASAMRSLDAYCGYQKAIWFPAVSDTSRFEMSSKTESDRDGPVSGHSGAEEEALYVANRTEYGLSSAVFTQDRERGVKFALRVEAGMTHVNDHKCRRYGDRPVRRREEQRARAVRRRVDLARVHPRSLGDRAAFQWSLFLLVLRD